jgi:ATP-binding cassette subfamily C protein
MENIKLKGSQIVITRDPSCFYEVISGTILVYAAPIGEDDETGRRTLIAEVETGEKIPAMVYHTEEHEEWVFIFSGLGQACIKEYTGVTEDTIMAFSASIKLKLFDAAEFAAEIVERVNMKLITEEGYIYATSEEQKDTYEKSLSVIYNLFSKKKYKGKADESGNNLYDTVAFICERENIKIASFDDVKQACGYKFTIDDIARVSHFICRDVLLEENWYKSDGGILLVYTQDNNNPVVCIPKGTKRYIVYDCKTGQSEILTKELALSLNPKAYMIYRPFENKKLGIKDLISFGLKEVKKTDIVNMLVFAFISTLIGLLIPYLNEKVFDSFIPLGYQTTLVQICFLIIAFSIGNLAFTIVKNLAIFRMSNSMEINVQSAVFDRLYNMPYSIYNQYESADLAMRALGISSIYKLLSEVALTTALSAMFSLLYLFRMFKYSNKLAWIGLLLILVNMLITFIFGWVQIKYEKQLVEKKSKMSSLMYQLISGISKIRIAGVENRALLQYLEPYVESKQLHIKNERLNNLATNVNMFLGVVFSSVFYYMMIVKDLEISFGEFMGYTSAFGAFSSAMITVVSAFLQVNNAIPIYERAKDILETPQEFEDDAIIQGKLLGKIDVNNLSFRYNKEEEMVLNDLSFCINSGEYIGIVGSSGSGKSTLLKILLGFETPTLGKVYYDDIDIESLDKRELRKRMGVVLQDGQLISGSIYENITITGENVSKKDIEKVIRDVGLEKDIAEMPMGLHTVVAEGAGTISGGQRQRILIARAIINKPNILYFDEATSALDNINQKLVSESLDKLQATRVVVAHRLSTVINCDRILVLENGMLIEEGSYEKLMAKKGRFYELAKRQIV